MTREQSIQRFGQKLRALRKKHQLTLKQLAEALGHSAHGYLSELETGAKLPSLELVIKLADFFEVTTDQLLRDELDIED
jgi:transcriptional regulator with XRE-family HTH domain